jgi:hypothetical protein
VKDSKLALAPVVAPGRAGTAERAIARCIETLSALVPQVDAELAGAAIMRVASRTESRNMIAGYLIAHPTALIDGDSGAPGPLARLIEDLIASGVEGLKPPRCLDCGEPKPLVRRVPGGRVCNRCRHRRRPLEACQLRHDRPSRETRRGRPRDLRALPAADLRVCGAPVRRLRHQPHLPDQEADLPRLRRAAAHHLRGVRASGRDPDRRDRRAVLALRGGHERAVP